MIALHEVTKAYGKLVVLDRYSLALPDTGFFAIMGPSGCGKTTLFRLLAGLEKPDTGRLENPHATIAYAFQEPRLFPWLTAAENAALTFAGDKREAFDSLLESLGVSEFADKHPHELSGGMKQRVSLARALAADADLLLLDEVFAGLDEETSLHLIDVIHMLRPDKLSLLITHNKIEAERFGEILLF